MYDPVLGRMLSPDKYVTTPYGTQGYNRYTYAHNNPLKFTDPDGNFPWAAVIVGAMIGGFVKGVQYDISGQGTFLGGFWRGAIVGAGGGYASYLAPIGVLPGLGFGAGSGAILGGLSSALDGRNIGNGMLQGGIMGGIAGAIMGGVEASKLGANIWSGNRPDHYAPVSLAGAGEGSGPVPYNDKSLKELHSKYYSDVKVSQITMERALKGTKLQKDGTWVLSDKSKALAVTQSSIWKHGRVHRIFFSPAAFSSKEKLVCVMAHELGHVVLNSSSYLYKLAHVQTQYGGESIFNNQGHVAIFKMQYDLDKLNNWGNLWRFNISDGLIMDWADSELYNAIKFLIRPIKF